MTAMDAITTRREPVDAEYRLATPAFAAALTASFATLTSFYLLLSALPAHLLATGADPLVPGLVTGGLMVAGVASEIGATGLIARIGAHRTFALGALALGGSALFVLIDGPVALILCCLVRGLGFGLTVVASGTILMALVPPERRGEGVGVFGFVASAPAVIALPLGVWAADRWGIGVVGVATAAIGLVAMIPALWRFGQGAPTPSPSSTPADSRPALRLRVAVRRGGLVRPALIFAASTVAAGVVVTFLPALSLSLAAPCLLVQALATAVSRWWSGRIGDRLGHSRMLAPAVILAGAGLALVLLPYPVALLSGMALFGLGFGATQTATLSMMAERVPPEGHGAVSAVWNLAYDVGYSVGPLAGGVVAAALGFPAVFGIVAGVVLLAVPLVRFDIIVMKRHHEEAYRR
ncbi:MAG TPA: MFS transporter [Glaciibacter sp.]|nr:MFS transporter [Glaciibacter sp.]